MEPLPHPSPSDNGYNASLHMGIFIFWIYIFDPQGPCLSVGSMFKNTTYNYGGFTSSELVQCGTA